MDTTRFFILLKMMLCLLRWTPETPAAAARRARPDAWESSGPRPLQGCAAPPGCTLRIWTWEKSPDYLPSRCAPHLRVFSELWLPEPSLLALSLWLRGGDSVWETPRASGTRGRVTSGRAAARNAVGTRWVSQRARRLSVNYHLLSSLISTFIQCVI